MEYIRKDIEINNFTIKIYENIAKDKLANLDNFHLSKNNYEYTSPTYTMIASINIDGDSIFQRSVHYSPESCLEIIYKDLQFSIRSFERLVNDDEYYRDFFIEQATIKKALFSDGSHAKYDDPFSHRLRKRVRKSKNNLNTFRSIMESII